MDDLAQYEYDKACKNQEQKTIEQYEMKIKLMLFDFKTIVEALNKAESIVKLIADDYRLPEAQGYFDDASK